MGETFIIDLSHYVDALDPSLDIPEPARRMATYFGNIAAAVTAMGLKVGETRVSALRCRRRPARKPCPGYLFLARQTEPNGIGWGCSTCDDNGFVYNFEGTPWDLSVGSDVRPDGKILSVVVAKEEFAVLRDFSIFDDAAERLVKGAENLPKAILMSGPAEAVDELAGELASYLNGKPLRGKTILLDRLYWKLENALKQKASSKITWMRR